MSNVEEKGKILDGRRGAPNSWMSRTANPTLIDLSHFYMSQGGEKVLMFYFRSSVLTKQNDLAVSNKRFLNVERFHFANVTTNPGMEKGFMGLLESQSTL